MIESIIETEAAPALGANLTGTLDAIAAGVKAVVGTGTDFDPEVVVGALISFLDTAGNRRYYTVATVTDDNNIILSQDTVSASTGGIVFQIATPSSPYVIGGDEKALSANELPIYCPVFGFVMTSTNPLNVADSLITRFFDFDEGALIKSIYVRYPYQYTGAARNLTCRFFQRNSDSSTTTLIDEIGSQGKIPIPIENIETPIDIYVPQFGTILTWSILAEINGAPVSQETTDANFGDVSVQPTLSNIDAPAALDGEYMPLIIGMRVLHATNLLAT